MLLGRKVIYSLSSLSGSGVHLVFWQKILAGYFAVSREEKEFEIDSNASEEDDEETIDQAEREEEGSRAEELLELEAEKDMPIEKLMAKYMLVNDRQFDILDRVTVLGSLCFIPILDGYLKNWNGTKLTHALDVNVTQRSAIKLWQV